MAQERYGLVSARVQVAKNGYQWITAVSNESAYYVPNVEEERDWLGGIMPELAEADANRQAEENIAGYYRRDMERALTSIDAQGDVLDMCKEGQAALPLCVPSMEKDLMTEQTLHRKFAALAREQNQEAAILEFANNWGWLQSPTRYYREIDGATLTGLCMGESLAFWQREIRDMAHVLGMLDFARSRSQTSLARFDERKYGRRFQWQDDGKVYLTQGKTRRYVAHYHDPAGESDYHVPENDAKAAAECYVAQQIDTRVATLSVGRYPWNNRIYKGEIRVGPRSLLGALWVLCMLEAHGNLTLAECPHCQTWFVPKHTDTIYCSRQCRQNARNARIRAEQTTEAA